MNNHNQIIDKNQSSTKNEIKNQTSNSSKKLQKSFKPQKYNLPKDIPPLSPYKIMVKKLKETFNSMPNKVELQKSDIIIRKELILEMNHFIKKYRLNPNSLFHCIYIMDTLLAMKINLNLEKIAIGSLLLSIKFNDLDGRIPPSKRFEQILISTHKMDSTELHLIEIKILKILDYNLSQPQPLYFINIFLLNGIIFNNDFDINHLDEKEKMFYCSIYVKPIEIYEEIIILSGEYFQYNPLYLACACIAISRELYNLPPWNTIFESVFNVYLNDFLNVYNFVKEKHKEYRVEMNKKKMLLLDKEKKQEKEFDLINLKRETSSNREKITYSSYTVDNVHKRLSTMSNSGSNNNNIIFKGNQRYDSYKNFSHSYLYKPLSFDIHSELQRNKIVKRKSNEKELNESNSSTQASASNTARSDIYNNNKLFYKKMIDSNEKIKNNITFSNYYKLKYNSDNKLINKKKYYNDNFQTMRFSQLSDSKKNFFIKEQRMNYIKMSLSSSFHKSNSSKKNYINESYLPNNYIPSTMSFNSEEKNYKIYGMNTISVFHVKDPYRSIKTLSNQSFNRSIPNKIIRNNDYNYIIGNENKI